MRFIVLAGFETAALTWLLSLRRWLRIPWSDLDTWLRVTPIEDAIAAVIWFVAFGCVLWLVGSTLLYVAACTSRVPGLIRSVEWMTLPAIRKVTEGALAAILVASPVAATPVWAETQPPVIAVVETDGTILPPGVAGRSPEVSDDGGSPQDAGIPPLPAFPHETGNGFFESPAERISVETGDNLWAICRRHLTDALGRRPTNEEIVPYWRRVIELNQPNLISGDPDLIYAGEVIELPPAD